MLVRQYHLLTGDCGIESSSELDPVIHPSDRHSNSGDGSSVSSSLSLSSVSSVSSVSPVSGSVGLTAGLLLRYSLVHGFSYRTFHWFSERDSKNTATAVTHHQQHHHHQLQHSNPQYSGTSQLIQPQNQNQNQPQLQTLQQTQQLTLQQQQQQLPNTNATTQVQSHSNSMESNKPTEMSSS